MTIAHCLMEGSCPGNILSRKNVCQANRCLLIEDVIYNPGVTVDCCNVQGGLSVIKAQNYIVTSYCVFKVGKISPDRIGFCQKKLGCDSN